MRNSAVLLVFLMAVCGGLLSEAADGMIDCGGLSVSSTHYLCCDGVPHPIIRGTPERCCGKAKIDMYAELCCDGVAYPKYGNMACCGTETFSSRGHYCCGDVVYSRTPGASCCDGFFYYRARQTCRDGKLVDKKIFVIKPQVN